MKRYLVFVAYPAQLVPANASGLPIVRRIAKRYGGVTIRNGVGDVNAFVGPCLLSAMKFETETEGRACMLGLLSHFNCYPSQSVPEATRQAALTERPKFAAWLKDWEKELLYSNGEILITEENKADGH